MLAGRHTFGKWAAGARERALLTGNDPLTPWKLPLGEENPVAVTATRAWAGGKNKTGTIRSDRTEKRTRAQTFPFFS